MISTNQTWRDFSENSTAYEIRLEFYLTNGVTFYLDSESIEMGSLSVSQSICEPGLLSIGRINSTMFKVSLINENNVFSEINFKGARIRPQFTARIGDATGTITKGTYYVDEAFFTGNHIDITAYDILSDASLNSAKLSGYSLSGKPAWSAIRDLLTINGYHPGNAKFPNPYTVLPSIIVGASDSPLKNDITKRQLAEYILEICGGFAMTTHSGISSEIYAFPIYDYSCSLDGGTFTFTDGDDADGGLFSAPFVTNYINLKQGSWSENYNYGSQGYERYTITNNANHFRITGSNSGNLYSDIKISEDFNLPPGKYRFGLQATSTYASRIELYNTTTRQRYNPTSKGTMLYSYDGSDVWRVTFSPPSMTNTTIQCYLYLTDYAWMGNASMQNVWQQTKELDGGLFRFLGSGVTTQYTALSKMIELPATSERKTVTGVRVIGENINTVEVGTEKGIVIEINNNPLITTQAYAETIAQQVYDTVAGVSYYEFTANWFADPRFEPGDIVSFQDVRGNTIITMCTSCNYAHGNISTISCVQ